MRWSQLLGRSLPAAAFAVATTVFAGLVATSPAAAQFGVVPGVGPTAPSLPPPAYSPPPRYPSAPSFPSFRPSTPSYRHTPSYQSQRVNDWSSRTQRQANSYQARASQQHQTMSRRTEMRLQQEQSRRQIQSHPTQRYYPRSGRSLFFRRTSGSVRVYPSRGYSPQLVPSGVDALSLK